MSKGEIRRTLRALRRGFVEEVERKRDRERLEREVASHVLAHLGNAKHVAAYLTDGQEVDPLPILQALAERGVTTALPHLSDRQAPMRFLRWSPGGPLVMGPFNLWQPPSDTPEVEPELILAPLLGFDRAMSRLGQGAGFYDRAFARHPRARRIGIAWSVQELPEIPVDPWDMPLHAVATELEWIEADA